MNKQIIDNFEKLVKQNQAEYLNAQIENDNKELIKQKFRLASNKKALNMIKKISFPIKKIKDLEGIQDIGKGSLKRIEEIINTGKLSELDNKYDDNKNNKISGIQELENVIGIGHKTAKKLVVEYKITSIEQLKKAIKNKKIIVSDKIKLGLKYYGVVKSNIPRKEISEINEYLIDIANEMDKYLQVIICGSYRRGKKTSGDIDVLIYHPLYKTIDQKINSKNTFLELFVNKLTLDNFLIDDMTDKDFRVKYMGFCKFENYPVRRIDIRFVPYNSLPFATLYFTGPYELNTFMRKKAKQNNMILNEYGLYKFDKEGNKISINLDSEEKIFKKLDIKYLTPKEREKFNTEISKKFK